MLYLTRRPAHFCADDEGYNVISTLDAGTICLLIKPHNIAAGIEWDKVMFNDQVGYIHCTLGDRVEEEETEGMSFPFPSA
jgi:hypothetical protein